MAWEKPFEKFWAAQEVTRGTAISAPTHDLNAHGKVRGVPTKGRGMNAGTLSDQHRSAIMRKDGAWEIDEQPANIFLAPLIFNSVFKGGVTPTQVASLAVYRSTFLRDMNSDTLKALTLWWGDPNVQMFKAAYGMIDTFSINADASSEDPVLWSFGGPNKFPSKVSAPSAPTTLNPPLLIPGKTQIFIDTGSGIGTTELTDRLISAGVDFDPGITKKFLAQGLASDLGYARTGRVAGHPVMNFQFEALDMTQYDLWAAGTDLKVRLIFNGPLILTDTGVDYYHSITFDMYGPFDDDMDWDTFADSNGSLPLSLSGQYDSGIGSDLSVVVQSNRASV